MYMRARMRLSIETGAEAKRADATQCAHSAIATAAADGAVGDDGREDSGAQASLHSATVAVCKAVPAAATQSLRD